MNLCQPQIQVHWSVTQAVQCYVDPEYIWLHECCMPTSLKKVTQFFAVETGRGFGFSDLENLQYDSITASEVSSYWLTRAFLHEAFKDNHHNKLRIYHLIARIDSI